MSSIRLIVSVLAVQLAMASFYGVGRLAAQASPGPSSQTPAPPSLPASANTAPQPATIPAATAIAYDTVALPSDPGAALDLIGKANGLGSDELQPWYLKAHYQAYDAKGHPATQGSIEIWWAAHDKYRVSYAGDTFTQTFYHSPGGWLRTGNPEHVPYAESLMWDEIMNPAKSLPKPTALKMKDRKPGQVQLTCIELPQENAPTGDSFCLGGRSLALRFSDRAGYAVIFNKIEIFQHRYVGGEVSISDLAQPVLTYSVDHLRGLSPAERALLTPPAGAALNPPVGDASLQSPSLLMKSSVLAGHRVSKTPPIYPAEAKQRHAQGVVRIRATIGKDGSVHNPVVVRDPDAALSQAALEAVSQWRYEPYLLNGSPIEVETTLVVTFRLGGLVVR